MKDPVLHTISSKSTGCIETFLDNTFGKES